MLEAWYGIPTVPFNSGEFDDDAIQGLAPIVNGLECPRSTYGPPRTAVLTEHSGNPRAQTHTAAIAAGRLIDKFIGESAHHNSEQFEGGGPAVALDSNGVAVGP